MNGLSHAADLSAGVVRGRRENAMHPQPFEGFAGIVLPDRAANLPLYDFFRYAKMEAGIQEPLGVPPKRGRNPPLSKVGSTVPHNTGKTCDTRRWVF